MSPDATVKSAERGEAAVSFVPNGSMVVPSSAGRGYRPALDGLRAFAVIAVVLYHLGLPGLPGGFLGVDLFFVLSGYLITGLLLDAHDRYGRINLA